MTHSPRALRSMDALAALFGVSEHDAGLSDTATPQGLVATASTQPGAARDHERRRVAALLEEELRRHGHPDCTVDVDLYDDATYLVWLQIGRYEESFALHAGQADEACLAAAWAAYGRLAVHILRACGPRVLGGHAA